MMMAEGRAVWYALGCMKNQTPTSGHGVPDAFLTKFGQQVTGVLCGFDRLRFRGTLRMLFDPAIMEIYLLRCGVLLKNFKAFAQGLTGRVKAATYRAAAAAGRPVRDLARPDQSKRTSPVRSPVRITFPRG